jgi:hypothetical protein
LNVGKIEIELVLFVLLFPNVPFLLLVKDTFERNAYLKENQEMKLSYSHHHSTQTLPHSHPQGSVTQHARDARAFAPALPLALGGAIITPGSQ